MYSIIYFKSFTATFEYTVSFLEILLMLYFLSSCLTTKFKGKKKTIIIKILYGFMVTDITMMVNFYKGNRISDFVLVGLILIFCLVFLKSKLLAKIILSIINVLLVYIVTYISKIITSFLTNKGLDYILNECGITRIIFKFLTLSILFIVYRLIINFLNRKEYKLTNSELIIMALVAVVSIYLAYCDYWVVGYGADIKRNVYYITMLCGIVIINLIVQYQFVKIGKEEKTRLTIEQKYNYQQKYINDVNEIYNQIRKTKHDLKNNITCAAMLINDKKYDEAIDYLQELSDDKLNITAIPVSTGNDIINCILSNKFFVCNQLGIKYDYQITGKINNISDVDLSIILGNLFDNSIEASSLCNDKRIHLKISNQKDYLEIHIENSLNQSVLTSNPNLESNKTDNKHHGIGIKSVKSVVEKYNGFIDFYEKDKMFICNVLLKIE